MGLLKNIGFVSLTTVLSIVVLFLLTKWMGAKQVSQMTMFDYVEGITIGSVAAELATDLDAPLNSLTALVIYGLAAVGISLWTSHSLTVRRVFTGKPLVLLENGVIYRENLKKAKLDLNEFLTFCRIGGWFDLNQLQTADNQKCKYRRKMLRPAAFSFQPACLHAQEHRYLPINHKHRQRI
mgnify:CR=1 FL=1